MKILFTRHAQIDLTLIEEYIARDSLSAAEDFLVAIRNACQSLEAFPDRNPKRPELFGDDPCRVLVFGDYLITYDVAEEDDAVIVLRILHGYLDLRGLRPR